MDVTVDIVKSCVFKQSIYCVTLNLRLMLRQVVTDHFITAA